MTKLKNYIKQNKKRIILYTIGGAMILAYGNRKFNKGYNYGLNKAADFVGTSVEIYEMLYKQSLDKELGTIMKFLLKK